jgi:hypothetical protein
VATEHQRRDLVAHGFSNVVIWSRGVDAELFQPCGRGALAVPRPIWMYAGRVAGGEKSRRLPLARPSRHEGHRRRRAGSRRARAPVSERAFPGYRFGSELAAHLSAADVFVFPSHTDTFRLVMLEAMACRRPSPPFRSPAIDVVTPGVNGALNDDLAAAAHEALRLDRDACRRSALTRTWARASSQFLSHLVRANDGVDLVAAQAA